jgi:ribosome biogenesis ATPase
MTNHLCVHRVLSLLKQTPDEKKSEEKKPEEKIVNGEVEDKPTEAADKPLAELSLQELTEWLKDKPPLTSEQLASMSIEQRDFEHALKGVQPSAKREGFATVPGVTWDDVGSLKDVREELKIAILVSRSDIPPDLDYDTK